MTIQICRRRLELALTLVYVAALAPAGSFAQEDGGPDFYRVTGVTSGSVLNLRAGPGVDHAVLARIPAGSTGLRNLGCEGGLSFAEWSEATEAERDAGRRQRWCRVEFRGIEGWVAGWFLAEGGPPEVDAQPQAATPDIRRVDVALDAGGSAAFSDRVVGYETVDYVVEALAGSVLSVTIVPENRFMFFNVLPPDSLTAVFAGAGSVTPDRWSDVLRDTGAYTVRVFLMRNAARRGEAGAYSIEIGLAASARPPLVGYVPARETDFDATAVTRCSLDNESLDDECGLGVYRGQTTQTVFVERPAGASAERGFVFRDSGVSIVGPGRLETRRVDDSWHLSVDGREHYVVPDVVLTGD